MRLNIDKKEFGLIIEHDQIQKRVRLIGTQINVAYEKQVPVFIGILNGSFMFMSDLMKEIDIAAEICFIKLASYEGENRKDEVQEIIGLCVDIKDREVILIEDIVDTGNTLNYLLERIKEKEPASVSICTLLLKPKKLQHQFKNIAYVGFEIPDDFVVGYGMDYNGLGRNLKDIYKAIE
ncbi:hypoxanthine phosphoribosyltransferase [Albibacterium sp.]|uniref:hypoxanthine phosphoribosyltransferase n=1 Tax=Albibacterium sp. TaxID=2952885 RepID=UPI002BCD9EC7|nr:hypoxanthine phosphoribosyltransferase [Albibacterium sp.]HUH17625.1 hypoxanthine phosphoribosyltransferase [Albibacterium sp.]